MMAELEEAHDPACASLPIEPAKVAEIKPPLSLNRATFMSNLKPEISTPARATFPQTLSLRPISRTKRIVTFVRVTDTSMPLVIPKILKFVEDDETLRQCCLVNWCFMQAATAKMYQNISLFGSSGPIMRKLLKLMSKAAEGGTLIDYRKCVRALEAADMTLDEDEVTPFQSWNTLRELIRRVSPSLERIFIDSSDPRFSDPEYILGCGLDQRVQFPRLCSLTVGPGCLAFSDAFLLDLLKRCPRNSLVSLRFPGCFKQMSVEGFRLISERGGTALQDLILTPPASYPPVFNASDLDSLPNQKVVVQQQQRHHPKNGCNHHGSSAGKADPALTWDFDILAAGLTLIMDSSPDLRALDISGHTQGLPPGLIARLVEKCPLLEELDFPCGITDAALSELLEAKPQHLWRINASCACWRSYLTAASNSVGPNSRTSSMSNLAASTPSTAGPCSSLTDAVVRAAIEKILPGKRGALLELPTHVVSVRTGKLAPTLQVLEEVGGARYDFRASNGTDAVYVPRIGVKVVVPNGRAFV